MSIKFHCSGCGKPFVLDEAFAGKKAKCRACGQVTRAPGAGVAAGEPESIRFHCEGCGKGYDTRPQFAGRTIACKACGRHIKVPGGRASGTSAPSTPATEVESSGPLPVDIYGLDEPSDAATKGPRGGGILAGEGERPGTARPGAGDEEAPLPRAAGYEPMTDAKRKRIARRAAKIEKEKPSYAGAAFGISFGAVLAVTLFGWRMYRNVQRGARLSGRVDAVASAPAEVNPGAMAAAIDRSVDDQVRQPSTVEARAWLDPARHPNHVVMEMASETARAMVAGFYERGAEEVYVLEPEAIGDSVVTAQFAVKLPEDPARRRACLEWEARYLQGEDPARDTGQKYLIIATD